MTALQRLIPSTSTACQLYVLLKENANTVIVTDNAIHDLA